MNITKEFILSVGANAAAIKNGADLVKKNSFLKLSADKDGTLIFGECKGSGSSPYNCSVDFQDEAAPIFRCTCPSRQIPCKHAIGLMWAYVENKPFDISDIPEDIARKRANKEKRAEKKAEETAEQPTSKAKGKKAVSNKNAALKKIDAQLLGIDEAEKLLQNIVMTGTGAIDAKAAADLFRITKQLDSYYIPGIQSQLYALVDLIKAKNELSHASISDKICGIDSLIGKSRRYLKEKRNDTDKMDTESETEELIGHPWKLEELKRCGLARENARFVQLAFTVKQEDDKKRFVDEGFYICLDSGNVYKTMNYRPYKALKHIKEENSINSVVNIAELFTYPSISLNPRVRWNESSLSEIEPADLQKIKSLAKADLQNVVKSVKNQLKALMLDRFPAVLVKFKEIKKVKGADGQFVLSDKENNSILLKESGYFAESFLYLLGELTPGEASGGAMLLLFHNSIEDGLLTAHPLALITDDRILKLVY